MNKKKISVLIMASAIAFNTVSYLSYVNVLADEVKEFKNLIIEEEIPQNQMTAVATSEQAGEDSSKAIDGNLNTMWHTPWSITDNSKLPQSLTIDLGGSNNVSSIKVSPRISQTNGIITKYEIYAINGNEETLVATGNWNLDNLAKVVDFDEPVKAEKIKITAVEAGAGFASIAEVNIYRVKEGVEKVASYENKKISNNNGIDISSDVESLKNLESGTIISRFDTSKGDIQSLISIGNNTVANGHFHLYVADNTVGFEVRNQSGNVATGKASAVLNKGINTVALKVTSGEGYKIFINGKLAGEIKTTAATLSAGVVGVNNVFIGKTDRASGNEYPFNGYIDFIDIYGEALSDKYLIDITGQTVLPSEEEILPEGMKTEPIDLFKPGDLGSQNFRIPALFTTKDGTVIASIDVRNQGGADAPWNDIDSAIKRKTLGGDWEEPQKVIDYPNRASVIDTSLTQDEETGRVFLLVTTFPENYGFWQSEAGSGYTEIDGVKYRSLYDVSGNLYTIRESGNVYDSEGNITNYNVNVNSMELTKDDNVVGNVMTASCELKVYGTSYLSLIYSDDDGATWSEPIDINSDIKADWMKFLGTGPGAGIQIENGQYAGRIVFPVYYTNGSGKQSSAVIYSDDHGETWNMGESPNDGRDLGNGSFSDSETMTDGLELTECQVVEMPNGQLKLFMRNTGSYVRIATSFDGGATWDAEVYEDKNLPEPYCQLSVMNYSKKIDGEDAIVFANPKGSGRTNGTVRFGIIKQNGTHSNGEPRYEFEWKYNKLVKAGTYAYSCLTELPNGDIGLFYEGTGNKEMSYIEMSPEYIKFDYESSLEELVDPGKIESIELLDGKSSYTPGDKIAVKLSFDQAVSLIGNKNLILKIGDSKIILNPISEGNAKEFKFEGTLPTTISEGTFSLVLECNNDIEILNTVGKNTTLNGDIELGNSITINKVIDKLDLVKVIENAKNIIENESDKYTESSIDALKEAIAIAEETVANEVVTQEQVEVAKIAVENAISRLEEKVEKPENVNKVALKISIDYANELKESGALDEVVSAVVQEFNKVLEEAISIYNNELATQDEVDTIFNNLVEVIHMLEFKQGDKSELENLINSTNALNKEDYTEESWSSLETILQEANKVFVDENAMQDEVNEIVNKLQQAIKELEEEKKVDKSILQGLVDKVKETDYSKYIPSTWTQFANNLEAANSILLNEAVTQEEVDSSYNKLLRSYLGLRLTPDKSLLEDLIKEVQGIDLSKYTAKSVERLKMFLEEGTMVLANEEATEKEVNTALENIKDAKNSLVASSDSNSNNNSNENSNESSNDKLESNDKSNSANSSTNNNIALSGTSTGNSITGKLPQTGTASVAGTLISGVLTLLCGLGLSRKKNN